MLCSDLPASWIHTLSLAFLVASHPYPLVHQCCRTTRFHKLHSYMLILTMCSFACPDVLLGVPSFYLFRSVKHSHHPNFPPLHPACQSFLPFHISASLIHPYSLQLIHQLSELAS